MVNSLTCNSPILPCSFYFSGLLLFVCSLYAFFFQNSSFGFAKCLFIPWFVFNLEFFHRGLTQWGWRSGRLCFGLRCFGNEWKTVGKWGTMHGNLKWSVFLQSVSRTLFDDVPFMYLLCASFSAYLESAISRFYHWCKVLLWHQILILDCTRNVS